MAPFDISDDPPSRGPVQSPSAEQNSLSDQQTKHGERRYVGVRFNCCGVYVRIYVNREGTAYEGRCPKCAKPVRLKVGPGGTDCRFFDVF